MPHQLSEHSPLLLIINEDSHPYWCRLPVLFLSAHTDTTTQNQVFAIGADDFVSKPVVATELANRILNRLERVRLQAGTYP